MFALIIIIHELWHFSAARKFWVKVEEFWIGIPPFAKKIFTDKKWTKYTLNWLPLWGFVRLKWENPDSLIKKTDKEAFVNKNYFQKSIILLAWVFMNFLLAIIIFSILFFIWVKPIWINSQIKTDLNIKIIPTVEQALKSWLLVQNNWIILNPLKNSIAENAWINKWDILLKVNNKKINSPEELMKIVWESGWKEIFFNINRIEENLNIAITPLPLVDAIWGLWKIWAYLSENIIVNRDFEYKYWLFNSIKYWTLETYNQVLLTFKWIGILFKKIFNPETPIERTEAIQNMKGPIWIVDLVANSLKSWVIFIIIIWAIISINLWVFNLLPIPALDWWRFLLISINSLFSKIFWKKAVNDNFENLIHIFFFIILIWLSLIIWYNDILNIFNK
jgi:regulator of sigma E protease